jgi:hypothetical protein
MNAKNFRIKNPRRPSNYRFNGILRVWEKQRREIIGEEEEPFCYYILKDEEGFSVSCSDELGKDIVVGNIYEVVGDVRIGRGYQYLSLTKTRPFRGSAYREINKEDE